MDVLYFDEHIVVCVKPNRILSTDEPGGLPDCLREHFALPNGDFRTVHRLDRVVGGAMVLGRNAGAASDLSEQIRLGTFDKEYLAVLHGCPSEKEGILEDLLGRDKARKMTYIASKNGKGIQKAKLFYQVLESSGDLTLVRVKLYTGRTHQIRVQFSGRGYPLVGERKYAVLNDDCEIGLWSHCIGFSHPQTKERLTFISMPPDRYPWNLFSYCNTQK